MAERERHLRFIAAPPIASPLNRTTRPPGPVDDLEPPQAVQNLWRRLREAIPSLPPSNIPRQGWREVQPGVGVFSKRQVLTGPGGAGKSYVLAQMHAETTGPRVWIDAQVTAGLEEALSFGAWACSVRQESLTLFVDALDAVASPGEFLAMLDRALAGRDAVVVVAARHTTWAEARDRLPGWEEMPLAGWSRERVRQLADRNRPEQLSQDLVELLRYPLLLDLFLRTFGPNEQIPSGLATRHGVLHSYFERRVLPASPRVAAPRRAALERGASAILTNNDRWLDPSAAAGELVGEGVFISTYGELAFRHALLRDFAVSLSLRHHDAAGIANHLKFVTNPAIRNDLLRGVLEARMDPALADAPGPPVESIVRTCASHRLSPGIALGSSDAPTAAFVAMLAPLEAGATFQQALDRARLVDNRIWIRVIASTGGARPPWLGDVQIDALSRLALYALETHDPAGESLARTLRGWTLGQVGDTWAMAKILKLVVRALPDDETLTWIASLRMRAIVTTGELLDALRHMLVSKPGLNADLGRRALANLVFDARTGDAPDNHWRWALVHKCLLSNGPEKPGLLSKRPEIALPIVFDLGALEAEKQRRWRDKEDAKPELREAFAKLVESLPPRPRDLEAEARLKRMPVLTEVDALGGLVDDAPWFFSHRIDDVGQLFNVVANLARKPASIPALVAAAKSSRSIRARLLVLDRGSAAGADAVQEVLADPRIYHSVRAQQVIHDAIARHWSAFPTEAREHIQHNILNVASSPMLRVTAVGHLAAAIPTSELDPQLVPYLHFWEQEQRTLYPDMPSAGNDLPGEIGPGDADRAPSESKRNEIFVRLQESIKDLPSGEAQRVLSRITGRGLLEEADHDAWFWISKVLEHDEAQAAPSLSGTCTRAIFDAALNRTRSAGGRELSFWSTLIDVAESAAAHVENQVDPAMRSALFAEIAAAAGQEATNREHAERALMFVRGWHWSRSDSPGRELFLRWFKQTLGAKALEHALDHLPYFDLDTRLELVTRVMETTGRLGPADPHLRELANSIGRVVAAWCMWIPDPTARDMFDRWRAERPGLLADDGVWRALLDGFSWNLQAGLREAGTGEDGTLKDAAIERYASLATAAWLAWPPLAEADHAAIAWALLSPLESDFEGPTRPWSYTLRPLLLSILTRARRVDLLAALPGLEWSQLDEATLVAAVEAMVERAQRSGEDPQVVLELIEALEKTGSLRTLPVSTAYKVLDALQTLGGQFPRATTAASSVEQRIRFDD